LGNFSTRLFISLSFVILAIVFSSVNAIAASLTWGTLLLTGLTWLVARSREASVLGEIVRHLAVAAVVIAVSRATGTLIATYVQ
jgi:hypothetical protein